MQNTSGFLPLGHRLLVLPDSVEQKTQSGIVLVQETTGRDEMAQVKGVVVAVGDGCWKDTTSTEWAKPGDRIVFGKYSGLQYAGADAVKYRILNDLDVVGLEVENAAR
jgi:co-chaperonin GroES (HSP10)